MADDVTRMTQRRTEKFINNFYSAEEPPSSTCVHLIRSHKASSSRNEQSVIIAASYFGFHCNCPGLWRYIWLCPRPQNITVRALLHKYIFPYIPRWSGFTYHQKSIGLNNGDFGDQFLVSTKPSPRTPTTFTTLFWYFAKQLIISFSHGMPDYLKSGITKGCYDSLSPERLCSYRVRGRHHIFQAAGIRQ